MLGREVRRQVPARGAVAAFRGARQRVLGQRSLGVQGLLLGRVQGLRVVTCSGFEGFWEQFRNFGFPEATSYGRVLQVWDEVNRIPKL